MFCIVYCKKLHAKHLDFTPQNRLRVKTSLKTYPLAYDPAVTVNYASSENEDTAKCIPWEITVVIASIWMGTDGLYQFNGDMIFIMPPKEDLTVN